MSGNEDKTLIRINDTLGRETEVKHAYGILLELFKGGIGQRGIAKILGIESQSLRNYRRTGRVSLYSTQKLSETFNIDRDFFNGKKSLTAKEIGIIKNRVLELKEEIISESEQYNTGNEKIEGVDRLNDRGLLAQLRDNCTDKNAFNFYSYKELEEIVDLLDKNYRIAKARAEILSIVGVD